MVLSTCVSPERNLRADQKPAFDLEQIRGRGKIIAVTDYNTANYFIYKGSPMGYQFELLEDFADQIGLQLEIKVEDDIALKGKMLKDLECDIIADNISMDYHLTDRFTFTEPHAQARQTLIQRRDTKRNHSTYISMMDELAGKTIYVPRNSNFVQEINNLIREIGDTIYIREVKVKTEKLIEWVANGKIDYTICNENVALINQSLYHNLDISFPVSSPQNLAWIVRSDAPDLLSFINDWLEDYKKTMKYQVLHQTYFKTGTIRNIAKSDYSTFKAGKMSAYDYAIKKYSEQIGWDWKLLASLIYQESRFKPNARSWAGAFGIMQLMPSTAQQYGVDTASGPVEQIRAGVKLLKWLDKRFMDDIPDNDERINFILASYNVGYGHVQDARRLARKHGKNANIWKDNVEYFLLNKSKPEYYNDDVVKHGYCRGTETYNYVREIIERYQHYTNLYVENQD